MIIRYWVNSKTRMCSMTTGPLKIGEMEDDGFAETTEAAMEEFRADTKKLIASGWSKSPRSLKKYLHVLDQ